MHDRLANATAFLKTKFPAKTDVKIATALGVHTVTSFRPTTPTFDQIYHGLGFAIDVNYAQNNWHIFKGDTTWTLYRVIGNATEPFGTTEVRSARNMAANSKKESTEDAHADIARSNDQLKCYRVLANDRAALETYLGSAECPESARKLGLAHWAKVLKDDEKKLSGPAQKMVGANGKSDHESGFMDLKVETVRALRDAGGLRWGGTDLDDASGDLMHFDGGFMPTAMGLPSDVTTARAQLSKEKAAAASPKKEAVAE